MLIDCGAMSWQDINPDIFGSMFQSAIDVDQRGSLGQHYTSVKNIMKVIQPLFLDKLHEELEKSRGNADKLKILIKRLQSIKVFDPACGSGNFLIIAYKELRRLEMSAFKALDSISSQKEIFMSGIRLSQFYGIEIDDFAHEIALLSLWLTEHQMNQAFKAEFGYADPTLPLRDSGNVFRENSLRVDWNKICPKSATDEVYVCGNPPFLGHAARDEEQNKDMAIVLADFEKFGRMDYVGCWFWKGANYIKGSKAELAFVATNSVCQGVQVELLWKHVLALGLHIKFAYRPFSWKNSARDNAAVHVSIIGLSEDTSIEKSLFNLLGDVWHKVPASNISPYLFPGPSIIVQGRSEPFGDNPQMYFGNMPRDGGNLFLTETEREVFLSESPAYAKWIRRVLGSDEFFNGGIRYCLWLEDISESELNSSPMLKARTEKVKQMRLASKAPSTRDFAKTPHLFAQRAQPKKGNYILVPRVSSARRYYIPVGFYDVSTVVTDAVQLIPGATLYHFGILSSRLHVDWLDTVAGKLKSDYRYSAVLVYNTFPWPTVSENKKKIIENLAETILHIREHYPEKTLAELYDPDKMPEDLLKAHQALDIAVEKLYRDRPFKDSSERLQCLFKMYEKLASADDPKKAEVGGQEDLW